MKEFWNIFGTTGNNLEWRRNKVLELSSQGFTQTEIATVLKVTHPTVNKDLAYLRQQAQENLQRHVHETVPEEYQKCMVDFLLTLLPINAGMKKEKRKTGYL